MKNKIKNTEWLLGGFQDHQNWRDDGICTTLTAAMGMGVGYAPVILQIKTHKFEKNSLLAIRK